MFTGSYPLTASGKAGLQNGIRATTSFSNGSKGTPPIMSTSSFAPGDLVKFRHLSLNASDFRLMILLSGRPSERDARLLPRQHGCQKPEFGLHFVRIGHRIGDLLAKEFAIPLAQPMNGDFERALGSVHFTSQLRIRRLSLIEKEHLQTIEIVQPSMLDELVPQPVHDSVEQG